MHLTKTYEDRNYIRIENSEGDSITVYVEDTTAFLLSIFVSFSNRGLGRGAELIASMESLLVRRGAKQFVANYSSKLLNLCDLLESCGFFVSECNPLICIDPLDVLSKPRVSAAVREGKKQDLFRPLISGFVCRLSEKYEAEDFDRITYIHANAKIRRLIEDYIGDCPGTEVNISFSADKTLSADKETVVIRDGANMASEDFMHAWMEEVSSVPYQNNIYVKGMFII